MLLLDLRREGLRRGQQALELWIAAGGHHLGTADARLELWHALRRVVARPPEHEELRLRAVGGTPLVRDGQSCDAGGMFLWAARRERRCIITSRDSLEWRVLPDDDQLSRPFLLINQLLRILPAVVELVLHLLLLRQMPVQLRQHGPDAALLLDV